MKPTTDWAKKFSKFDRWALCPSRECVGHNKIYAARPLGHTCVCWQKSLGDKHLDPLPHGNVLNVFRKLESTVGTIVGESWNLKREAWLPLYTRTQKLTFIWVRKHDFHNSHVGLDLRLCYFTISFSLLAYFYYWTLSKISHFWVYLQFLQSLAINFAKSNHLTFKWISARTPPFQFACWTTRQINSCKYWPTPHESAQPTKNFKILTKALLDWLILEIVPFSASANIS